MVVCFKQIKQDLKLEDVENGDLIHVGDEDYTKEQMEAAEEVVAKWDYQECFHQLNTAKPLFQ
ncbi:hypothetical protein ABMB44_13825 [Levilactobacillus brevis]